MRNLKLSKLIKSFTVINLEWNKSQFLHTWFHGKNCQSFYFTWNRNPLVKCFTFFFFVNLKFLQILIHVTRNNVIFREFSFFNVKLQLTCKIWHNHQHVFSRFHSWFWHEILGKKCHRNPKMLIRVGKMKQIVLSQLLVRLSDQH